MDFDKLKPNDYYYAEYGNPNEWVIVKGTEGRRPNIYISDVRKTFWKENKSEAKQNIRIAEPKEIHWIEECIRMNTYVSFEEAMESFITPTIYPEGPDPELEIILRRKLNLN